MMQYKDNVCTLCGGRVKYYDKVLRIVRLAEKNVIRIYIQRFKCMSCGRIHRKLPSNLQPYKQYDARIITGVVNGTITSNMIEYEDYPYEMTMKRWKSLLST